MWRGVTPLPPALCCCCHRAAGSIDHHRGVAWRSAPFNVFKILSTIDFAVCLVLWQRHQRMLVAII
jgi:hypothetical protein